MISLSIWLLCFRFPHMLVLYNLLATRNSIGYIQTPEKEYYCSDDQADGDYVERRGAINGQCRRFPASWSQNLDQLASNFAVITKSPFFQEMASEDCLFPGSCVRCSLLVADGSLFTKKPLLSHFDVCKDILQLHKKDILIKNKFYRTICSK